MRRVIAGLLILATGACGPARVNMAATDASELLARFAAGSAPADVCTPEGRAVLRGAVRAYGAAMELNGVAWPVAPEFDGEARQTVNSVDISVLVAFAAGFVETSDFHGRARGMVTQLSFAQWPEIGGMRRAARVACPEVVELQQAAARVVVEAQRYAQLSARAERERGSRAAVDHVRRQGVRLQRAQTQMQTIAAVVQARMEAAS
jgi:hypothetical protein